MEATGWTVKRHICTNCEVIASTVHEQLRTERSEQTVLNNKNSKERFRWASRLRRAASRPLQTNYHLHRVRLLSGSWDCRTGFGIGIVSGVAIVVAQCTRASLTEVSVVAGCVADRMQKTYENDSHVVAAKASHLTVGCKATCHQLLTNLTANHPVTHSVDSSAYFYTINFVFTTNLLLSLIWSKPSTWLMNTKQ